MRWLLIFALLAPSVLMAGSKQDPDEVRARLQKALDGAQIGEISDSPIPGFYETTFNGEIVYTDGKYLLQGDIYELDGLRNLTKLSVLESISDADTVVFAPKKTKHTLTIFTDTTCGYCRKLHQEVSKLNEHGIKVRYMMYPRQGPGSPSAKTLESVWCADNPQEAMTAAKAGESIPEKQCATPLEEHMNLARRLGLRGTPLIVADNGTVIPGYRPADQLISMLNGQ